jgi:membrane protein
MGRTKQSVAAWLERRSWGKVLVATFINANQDKAGVVAGGVALYTFLGMLPALIALVAIAGLVTDKQQAQSVIRLLSDSVPGGHDKVIATQLAPVLAGGRLTLGVALVAGTIGAVWGLSTAVDNAFVAMEVAYGIEKGRGFVRNRAISLLFTVGALAAGLALLLVLFGLPSIARAREFQGFTRALLGWGRWPFLAAAVFGGFLFVFRYGIRRRKVKWKDLLWGACFATGIWLFGSIVFTVWISYVADYSAFYGSLSTLVVAMLWFLLSGFALVLGAEMNVVLDRRRRKKPLWQENNPK